MTTTVLNKNQNIVQIYKGIRTCDDENSFYCVYLETLKDSPQYESPSDKLQQILPQVSINSDTDWLGLCHHITNMPEEYNGKAS